MRNRAMRTRAGLQREKAGWSWSAWNRARRRKKVQRQLARSIQKSPWTGLIGGLVAGTAGLLAFFAMQSAAEKKNAGTIAASLASDPLTAPRFDRKRAFGWF